MGFGHQMKEEQFKKLVYPQWFWTMTFNNAYSLLQVANVCIDQLMPLFLPCAIDYVSVRLIFKSEDEVYPWEQVCAVR
jgi:hypothetical protein